MDKQLRKYYYAAIVNLLLWMPLLTVHVFIPTTADPDRQAAAKFTVIAGAVLAALLQHWTYYDIYKGKLRLAAAIRNEPVA